MLTLLHFLCYGVYCVFDKMREGMWYPMLPLRFRSDEIDGGHFQWKRPPMFEPFKVEWIVGNTVWLTAEYMTMGIVSHFYMC